MAAPTPQLVARAPRHGPSTEDCTVPTFRSSARTVDMLGRQQVADTATAVTELWKNAFDAYATSAQAIHLVKDHVLVVSDDGVGMDFSTFESQWLTLGTSDKHDKVLAPRLKAYADAHELAVRPVMGEKGIGRLALALLGSQGIVITRGEADDGTLETTAAWICWELFELPGLMLDDIEVPVDTTADQDPDLAAMVMGLRERVHASINSACKVAAELPDEDRKACLAGLATVRELLDATELDIPRHVAELGLAIRHGTGTALFVYPVADQLHQDVLAAMGTRTLTTEQNADLHDTKFLRLVRDFTDHLSDYSDMPQSSFDTNYIIVRGNDDVLNLQKDDLGTLDPWTRAELDLADHVFEGAFDELGHWHGTVSLYGRQPFAYTAVNLRAQGRPTRCGPFHLTLGSVEAVAGRSKLPSDDHAHMRARLDRASGLYVFRDGIRVLPYGSYDIDYLGIEERRTKNAGRYYFSHRNLFGAVSLTWAANSSLREKAGREGFRQDQAFRDFRHVLNNLLLSLAKDHLGTQAAQAEDSVVLEERGEITRRQALARDSDRRAKHLQADFGRTLVDASRRMDAAAAILDDLINAAAAADDEQFDAEHWFEQIDLAVHGLPPSAPAGVGLDADLRHDLDDLRERFATTVQPALHEARERIAELAAGGNVRDAVDLISARAIRAVEGRSEALAAAIAELAAAGGGRLDEVALIAAEVAAADPEEARAARDRVDDATTRFDEVLDLIGRATDDVRTSASLLVVEAVRQERLAELEAELDQNADLAQIGMAVAIISHEFESNIRGIRDQLRRLRTWGRKNPNLKRLSDDLTASFEHLDGYLRLFTPLQRRLHRATSEISGAQVDEFLRNLFADRLRKTGTQLVTSTDFKAHSVVGYPSTFYPVFINVVDNALHWLSTVDADRRIELGMVDGCFAVSNNGPPISARHRPRVFQRGFTTRDGGRGLGLYLARESLWNAGWDLELDASIGNRGARFVIRPALGENAP
jgi:signal transduction histidine kinase